MEEIEEIKIENNKADEIKAENRVQITKVIFSSGDFIFVSGNDISIIERFINAGNKLESLGKELEEKENGGAETDYEKEIEKHRIFSEKAAEIMDGVFGDGATRKFFRDVYEMIPNFQPDLECFLDFWDSLIPVIEKLSEHKVKLEKLASRQRMAKYKPQDHRKPGSK